MSSVEVLFSIVFKSDFYKDGICDAFKIVPTNESKEFFKEHGIRDIERGKAFDVVWITKDKKNVEKCFKNTFEGKILTFDVFVKGRNIFSVCDVDFRRFYKFENKKGNKKLHKGDFVTVDDSIEKSECLGDLCGNIKIKIESSFGKEYEIKFGDILSFWRIFVSDDKKKIKNVSSFKINDIECDFSKSKDGYFELKDSMPLREDGFYSCLMKYKSVDKNDCEIFIPVPKKYIIDEKKNNLVSNIFCVV